MDTGAPAAEPNFGSAPEGIDDFRVDIAWRIQKAETEQNQSPHMMQFFRQSYIDIAFLYICLANAIVPSG